ncbi:MAG TPA: tetratricopeptide repeat protein [Stellaceae bacterium]|jgi:predicted O-linked N-acetylglucosamine transferase (SPINDLY family)|nr:tetratricopeptide repeat protein [Stellaceae bacterium]
MPDVPQRIDVLIAEGVRQQQAENFDAAGRAYRAALQLDPTHPQALALLGMLAGMFGEFQPAIDFFLRALQRDPNNADLYNNLGETYRHLGDVAKALPCFAKAIELRPDLYIAYRSAADTAIAAIENAEKPEHARELARLALQYRRTLGTLLHKAWHREALPVLREALDLDPLDVETLRELGTCLYDCGIASEAVDMFERAIALDPTNPNTYSQLGTALYQLRRWEEDQAAFRAALRLDPQHKIARANLVTCGLMHWLYEDAPTADDVYRRHREWGDAITTELAATAAAEAAPFPNTSDPDRKLRVAFLSGDFKNHPVAQFFRPLLEQHDRNAIEIYCYTEKERTSDHTPVLQKLGGIWRIDSIDAPDAALRAQLRADSIDIAIDLSGQTAGTRLAALAIRATPVTATWLGYPATTGLTTIDWRITDALADPPGHERYYTEKLLRLPDGFLCYEPRVANLPAVSPVPALSRGGAVTFGSFNNALKLTPATIRCWAAILAALPTARLVLKAGYLADPALRSSLEIQFAALGIAASRVELRAHLTEMGDHFSAYGEIDIALDPLVYNGTTTTCEALWMGVPVISMIGDRHAARVGLDLLSRVGLSELAAADVDAYVALAASLAGDLPRLQRIRQALRERMRRSPLCDATGFARRFEAGLRTMWRDWCAQHPA